MKKKIVGVAAIILFVPAALFLFPDILPAVGDSYSPVNSYLSTYYIENSLTDTGAHNMVTAVLADYRGFDTLFETCVMFLAGTTALMVLSSTAKVNKSQRSSHEIDRVSFSGTILDTAFRVIVPIIVIYAYKAKVRIYMHFMFLLTVRQAWAAAFRPVRFLQSHT